LEQLLHRAGSVSKNTKMNRANTPTGATEKPIRKERQNRGGSPLATMRAPAEPAGTPRSRVALEALRLGVVLWFLWWLLGPR
jgi:hypothetical protein